jgi:hypothetical protein
MGFWDSLKAAFLGGFGVDYYSKKSSESLADIRDSLHAGPVQASVSPDVLVEFQTQVLAVDRVVTAEWPAALQTEDLSVVQATVSRTLPVLDRMNALLSWSAGLACSPTRSRPRPLSGDGSWLAPSTRPLESTPRL